MPFQCLIVMSDTIYAHDKHNQNTTYPSTPIQPAQIYLIFHLSYSVILAVKHYHVPGKITDISRLQIALAENRRASEMPALNRPYPVKSIVLFVVISRFDLDKLSIHADQGYRGTFKNAFEIFHNDRFTI